MKPIVRNLFLLALVGYANAQTISVNFGSNEAPGAIDTASAVPAGAIPVPGSVWNNMSGATQTTPISLIDSTGASSGATVTWSSANTWRSASPGSTATSQNGALTRGYLDDGGGGNSVTISNVPFLSYNVYVIRASDQGALANYRPLTVNGVTYQGDQPMGTLSTSTIVGNAATTGTNWTAADTMFDGQNYHRIANTAGLTLSVRGNTGTGRGPIAGIQIENTYAGTVRYWDANGSTAGSGGATPSGTWDAASTNWNNAAGTGTPTAWSDENSVANFSAGSDSTGTYTVTVDGTRSADAVILQRGNLTLTGGTVNLTNARLLRSITQGSTLRIDSAISADGSIAAEGAGAVTIAGNAAHTGATVLTGTIFTLETTGNLSATSAIDVATNSTAILKGQAAVAGNISLSGSTVYLSDSANVTSTGNILLNNVGSTQILNITDNASLEATSATAGEFFLNRGDVSLTGNAELTVRGFYNRTGNITTTLNVGDNATFTSTGFLTLGDNTAAAMVVNQTGGTVNSLGNVNNPGGNSMSNRWGHWGSNATTAYNLSGGTLNMPNAPLYLSWDSGASLNITGTGTANIVGVNMGFGARVNPATISIGTGGKLNIGSAGIITGGGAGKSLVLAGGTLGASAPWAGNVPVSLTAPSVIDTTGGTISLDGGIAGEGSLTVQGTGTLALGGANTYTGATTVASGTLRVQGSGFPSEITVNSGATLGAGTPNAPGSAYLENIKLLDGSKSDFRVSATASDLIDAFDVNVTGTHTITITPGGLLETGQEYIIFPYQTLSGAGYAGINVVASTPRLAITKLPNNNASIGIRVDSFDSLIWKGNNATNPTLWNTTTQNFLTSATNNATAFLAGDVVLFDDTASSGNVVLEGSINPFALQFDNSTIAYNLSGAAITGPAGLLKKGTAALTLGNDNTYTGTTRVEAGTLNIGNGTTGSIATASAVEIIAGQVNINTAPGSTYSNPTLIEAEAQLTTTGTGDLTLTGPISGAGNLFFDRDGVTLLTAANTATGTVTVNTGTFAVDGSQVANRLPINKLVTVNPGAGFEIRGVNALPNWANSPDVSLTSATLTVVSGASPAAVDSHAHLRNIILDGSEIVLNYSGAGTAYSTESFQLNGTLTVTGTAPSTITTGAGGDATNTGIAIQGNRVFEIADVTSSPDPDLIVNAELEDHDGLLGILTKQGPGTLALNATNSYTGGNEILAGTVIASTLADGPGSLGSGYLALKNGSTLQYTGTAPEITTRFLWLDTGASVFNITEATGDLNFTPGDSRATQPIIKTGPGALTLNMALSEGASVTVQAGTLSLPGLNTHTGDTTVTGGTLVVSGNTLPDTARLTVSGTGTIRMDANETVNTLVLGSTQMDAGTYGAPGSGAETTDARFTGTGILTVLAGPSGASYASWIDGFFPGITDPTIIGATADPDGDGIPNAVEMVIGNAPNVAGRGNLPTLALVTDPAGVPAGSYLKFSFRRTQLSADANVASAAQYGPDLVAWTNAISGTAGVTVIETPDATLPGDLVDVYIPRTLATGGKLFGRLQVTVP